MYKKLFLRKYKGGRYNGPLFGLTTRLREVTSQKTLILIVCCICAKVTLPQGDFSVSLNTFYVDLRFTSRYGKCGEHTVV
jgi:hypothetical protein